MDEKDFDLKNESDALVDVDDSLESRDGVNYETNDNWEFEAEAPTLKDNFVIGEDNFDISSQDNSTEPAQPDNEQLPETKEKSNTFVINKDVFKFVPIALFVAIVIAVVSVLGVRYYTVPNGKEGKLMNPGSVVATVDGTKISVGMYGYYYSSIVSYYEQYASYGYYNLDTTQDYSAQFTTNDDGETVSWAQFFQDEAIEEIKNITVYYNAGIKAGVTLTDTQKETIESQIASLEESASQNSVSLDQYIKATFGNYCSVDTLRNMLEQYYISANYRGMISASSRFSDDDINAYYKEHSDDFKQIDFVYLAFEYDSTDDASQKKSIQNVEKYMAKMTDAKAVEKLVPEVYKDYIKADAQSMMSQSESISEEEAIATATENYIDNVVANVSGSSSPFDEETTKWLFSDDTKIGSTNYFVDESAGYVYAILKTEKASIQEDESYTVRHILITPEADKTEEASEENEQTEYTDEQMAAAKSKAEKILDEFNKGDKTEYSFALLAEQYSADTASTSAGSSDMFGGLYESVELGKMVKNFEDWSIDDSRKYGDTGIVESDYGYHIMFFIGKYPLYQSQIVTKLKAVKSEAVAENIDVAIHQNVIDKVTDSYAASKSSAEQ